MLGLYLESSIQTVFLSPAGNSGNGRLFAAKTAVRVRVKTGLKGVLYDMHTAVQTRVGIGLKSALC